MPTQLTIPVKPQFGVGQFETSSAFHGAQALRWAWGGTFGILLPSFDEAFTPFGAGSQVTLPDNFFAASGQITLGNIGQILTHTQHAAVNEHVQRAFVSDGLASSIERAALDILSEKKKTARKVAPPQIIKIIKPVQRANLAPVTKTANAAVKRAEKAEAEVKALRARVAAVERKQKPHSIAWPGIPGRVGELERDRDRDRGDINKILRRIAGLGALALIVSKVLEKMGASYIRCNANKRWGRHLCQNGSNFLSDLIAATTLLVGTFSLLGFAAVMRDAMADTIPLIRKFWQVSDDALGAVYSTFLDEVDLDWHPV